MTVAKGLTEHTIVVVVDKRERAIAMQSILKKGGFRVVMALSLYDALQFVSQEMPHLVITESILSDGNAGVLYDRLQQHPLLQKTPILVNVLKKSREEIEALAKRKFAGFFLGTPEPRALFAKIAEVIAAFGEISPHYFSVGEMNIKEDLTVFMETSVLGRSGDQVVAKSTVELDPAASLLCIPDDGERYGPAVFRMASNLSQGEGTFNLFPMNRIVGKGRVWIEKLPEISMEGDSAQVRKVIYYDPSEERYQQFSEILGGYDIELIHAPTLSRAASLLRQRGEDVGCIYLYELTNASSSIEWKNAYAKIPEKSRPPVIVGTTSQNARSTSTLRYIQRPFGLGVFVEMLQAAFERASALAEKTGDGSYGGVSGKFRAPAKLIGLDETGGVLQVRFPIVKGCSLKVDHEFLVTTWGGESQVTVVATAPLPDKSDVWQLRFSSIGAGLSKTKYWDKVIKAVENQKASQPAPPEQDVQPDSESSETLQEAG